MDPFMVDVDPCYLSLENWKNITWNNISRNSKVIIMDVWRKIRVSSTSGIPLEKPPGIGRDSPTSSSWWVVLWKHRFSMGQKLDHVPSFTMTLYAALLCSSFLPETCCVFETWLNTGPTRKQKYAQMLKKKGRSFRFELTVDNGRG